MEVLPLLFVSIFCLLVVKTSRPDEWKGQPVSPDAKDWNHGRFRRLSPEAKGRLARMEGPKPLTAEQKVKLKEGVSKAPRFEKSEDDKTADLFEVNRKEGVSKFMYQGDIVLTEEQVEETRSSSGPARNKRQARTSVPRWTNNTVYYFFDSSINERKKAVVAEALEFIQSRTCIKFIQNSTAVHRIRVFNGSGCFSHVGMTSNPDQILSLGDGCEYFRPAAHEFMHALGIDHIQTRYDRDDYVSVDLSYVAENDTLNFNMLTINNSVNYAPYEYGSIMHYTATDTSTTPGKYPMIPKDIDYFHQMGASDKPTFLDIFTINKHYGCDAACPAVTSAKCKNGGVPHVHNCSVCMCPIGYHGTLCDQRPPGCGETLAATDSWQLKSSSYAGNAKTHCTFWIEALEGQKIEIQLTDMTGARCQNGCYSNGVEIKRGPDNRIAFPKYCCQEFINRVTQSSANPTPLIIYNHQFSTNFTFKYRAVPANPISSTLPPTTTTTELPTTTTKLPATTKRNCQRTTTPPLLARNCTSKLSVEECTQSKANGYCTDPHTSFQAIKYDCARECGLCGKAANPCFDFAIGCSPENCATYDTMYMEHVCAKTCGYCDHPN